MRGRVVVKRRARFRPAGGKSEGECRDQRDRRVGFDVQFCCIHVLLSVFYALGVMPSLGAHALPSDTTIRLVCALRLRATKAILGKQFTATWIMRKHKKPPGKQPERHQDVPLDWQDRLDDFCRANWRMHAKTGEVFDLATFTKISRKTFFDAGKKGWFTKSMFARLAEAVGCRTQTELLKVLSPPSPAIVPAAAIQQPTIDKLSIQMIGEQLLTDHLTGISFAELGGNKAALKSAVNSQNEWLKKHPEDLFIRAGLLWSVLNNGNPSEMVEFLNETAVWLDSNFTDSKSQSDPTVWRSAIEAKINQLKHGTVEAPEAVRRHLEDTLGRAALLRCLKYQGKHSRLRKEFVSLGNELSKQPVLKGLLVSEQLMQGDDWVAKAVLFTERWTGCESETGLARLCQLWFKGRQRQPGAMGYAIEQSCCWLDANPNHTFVRWATIWLAGRCAEARMIDRLIQQSSLWLKTQATDDERLVRMGFLWFVGAWGNGMHVREAITDTTKWLKSHPDDDFIRILYLLFLVRRRCSAKERKKAVAETRKWLLTHADLYGLTDLALRLCDSVAE